MTEPIVILPLLLATLLACCFFNLAEVALFSLQAVDRERLKEDGSAAARAALHLLGQPRRILAALLIGVEVGNIALASVSAQVVGRAFPEVPWLNVVIVAPILVLFGDVLPKALGFHFAREAARLVSRPLVVWNELIAPVRFLITWVSDAALGGLGVKPVNETASVREEQFRVLIDRGRETGVVQPMEQEIIHRVFEFGDLPVSRLCTPRRDIFSLSVATPWPEVVEAVREARYSRVPIWSGDPENIVGILLLKDLLRARSNPPGNPRQFQKMLHPATFVPPTKRAADLLGEFRARTNHMAIVVDEHGACVGLVTLDDLLTELVGEVLDETDTISEDSVQADGDGYLVRAGMDIDDFGQRLGLEIPDGDWTTVAGFVIHLLGSVPEEGAEARWEGVSFVVKGVDGRRITEVRVTIPAAGPRLTEAAE
jgi:CBS domain containing-hemolysin-like protein